MYLPHPKDGDFELPPAGTHIGTCIRVLDLGTQETTYMGVVDEKHQVCISWELPEELMESGKPFMVSKTYTFSMGSKANLKKDLEAWRGVPFAPTDFGENGFNIKNILGKSCLLTITHTAKNDKEYANVTGVARLMKGQTAPKGTVNDQLYLCLEPELFNPQVFNALSDYWKKKIAQSPEYQNLHGSAPDESQAAKPTTRVPVEEEIPF